MSDESPPSCPCEHVRRARRSDRLEDQRDERHRPAHPDQDESTQRQCRKHEQLHRRRHDEPHRVRPQLDPPQSGTDAEQADRQCGGRERIQDSDDDLGHVERQRAHRGTQEPHASTSGFSTTLPTSESNELLSTRNTSNPSVAITFTSGTEHRTHDPRECGTLPRSQTHREGYSDIRIEADRSLQHRCECSGCRGDHPVECEEDSRDEQRGNDDGHRHSPHRNSPEVDGRDARDRSIGSRTKYARRSCSRPEVGAGEASQPTQHRSQCEQRRDRDQRRRDRPHRHAAPPLVTCMRRPCHLHAQTWSGLVPLPVLSRRRGVMRRLSTRLPRMPESRRFQACRTHCSEPSSTSHHARTADRWSPAISSAHDTPNERTTLMAGSTFNPIRDIDRFFSEVTRTPNAVGLPAIRTERVQADVRIAGRPTALGVLVTSEKKRSMSRMGLKVDPADEGGPFIRRVVRGADRWRPAVSSPCMMARARRLAAVSPTRLNLVAFGHPWKSGGQPPHDAAPS